MKEKLLSVKNLQKGYSGRVIVSDLSFDIDAGEVVGLLGPNGAGKTTAFYMTIGLVKPDSGQVFFNGVDVTKTPVHKRAKMGMGYLAQEPSVFRQLTVKDNILCILEVLKLSRKKRQERLDELLEELHLSHLSNKRAATLSGGERRRLEITRALVTNPSLLLLDEPFANIDPKTIADVQKMIRHLTAKGISVLITDHNAREIFSIANRSYLMQGGSCIAQGNTEELISNVTVREAYLGDDFKL
ncbi:MAG: LPS export ABC transporter ATP-binding protein [Chlamydiales bacterium]|nr:LPS export ABC transporter ATP-binding protein [Chlamydiales bacterium]